jgi:hypothetical protein
MLETLLDAGNSSTGDENIRAKHVSEGAALQPGFPLFKANQFQDLFKTELLRNQDPIDKIWTNFDEGSDRRKANQRIWNDVPTAPE